MVLSSLQLYFRELLSSTPSTLIEGESLDGIITGGYTSADHSELSVVGYKCRHCTFYTTLFDTCVVPGCHR